MLIKIIVKLPEFIIRGSDNLAKDVLKVTFQITEMCLWVMVMYLIWKVCN